ncbi:hypothetical protein, partial [Acinetobacter bereziniae]|uniref:hypothetical protein n=1 Tax=Acinetobacter bereziniae TaxID=106648 RepID=UPI003AF8B558
RALYRRSLEYGLGITAVSKVFYSVANFIYLAIPEHIFFQNSIGLFDISFVNFRVELFATLF